MANYCDSTYKITGDASELDALIALMRKLEKEKENGTWVGHIVEALHGSSPKHLYMRGWWEELEREKDCIKFRLESAWEPLYETWDFICKKFNTLQAYFIGEEPGCEVFQKRANEEKGWFLDKFYVNACTPDGEYINEYFTDIDEAYRYIERISDTNIITAHQVEALNLTWNEENEDAYIYLHEFKEV
ncbi:hypothetical protein [uncultured Duncaniella sp.]|jgi:hypothetical protein|uniref:hypothetical protein n=2 Tax=uncultured Duncaniella sp. TaxID=2768039 RepID=UPI000F486EA1|nr:hypothetical protein [uncultured Duncaniella sp.]ROS87174.1 hypothetical protein EEL39_10430 [Muribaculaceae bacterium Isolate-080 (Janvier)]